MLVVSEFFTSDELSELYYIIDNSHYFKDKWWSGDSWLYANHPEVKVQSIRKA